MTKICKTCNQSGDHEACQFHELKSYVWNRRISRLVDRIREWFR